MTYQPAKNGQYQPATSTSAKDCVAATTALLIERATVGAKRYNHVDIRRASGAPSTRGLWLSEAIAAAKKYGVTVTGFYAIGRDDVKALVDGGRAVGLLIDCSVTRYTARRTNTYTGPHMVYVNDYTWWPAGDVCGCERKTTQAHAEFTIDDPGTTTAGFLQWSASLAYRAAEGYGSGRIYLLAAPDTEGRTWTGAMTGRLRAQPATDAADRGAIVIGREYTGGRTENGGSWKRADGTTADGWVHVKSGLRWSWARGEAMR